MSGIVGHPSWKAMPVDFSPMRETQATSAARRAKPAAEQIPTSATPSPVSYSSMKEFIRPIHPLADPKDCTRKVNELVNLMNRILDVHPRLLKELEEERAMKGI